MGKNIYLTRYSLIIKRLEKGAATYEQINEYLQKESELQQLDYTVSLRTLQRDIKDIYSLLDYEIVNEKAGENRYYIKERPEEIINGKRLLENFQMSLAIRLANQYHHYIFSLAIIYYLDFTVPFTMMVMTKANTFTILFMDLIQIFTVAMLSMMMMMTLLHL